MPKADEKVSMREGGRATTKTSRPGIKGNPGSKKEKEREEQHLAWPGASPYKFLAMRDFPIIGWEASVWLAGHI